MITTPLRKYSKPSGFYIQTKKEFFVENDALLKKTARQNQIYKGQPVREFCKICGGKLSTSADFISHHIAYTFCSGCGHLNGTHQDTQEFIQRIYQADHVL